MSNVSTKETGDIYPNALKTRTFLKLELHISSLHSTTYLRAKSAVIWSSNINEKNKYGRFCNCCKKKASAIILNRVCLKISDGYLLLLLSVLPFLNYEIYDAFKEFKSCTEHLCKWFLILKGLHIEEK